MQFLRPTLIAILAVTLAGPAHAYIGPGAGLGAIMVTIALVLGVLLLLFGFVWYPLRRMMRKRKESAGDQTE